ncbi:MAG: hypothetical protein H7333_08210 [Bdellovibrionales bacterium]|nr:hypothetical protein [Oligoflexia bacterium]
MSSSTDSGKTPSGKSLAVAVEHFLARVVDNPKIESAWLSALSHMEELAGKQVLKSVSADTPPDFLAEIYRHSADETRHALEFKQMRPFPILEGPSLKYLEEKFKEITGSFVIGYFGNPLLVKARNRHLAYVHGALTIEQFPFQLYTVYLKMTRLPAVLERLPAVLADEINHLALGRKLRDLVSEEDRLSLNELNEIERDMCLKMVERLRRVVEVFTGESVEAEAQDFARLVNREDAVRIAWTHALSQVSKLLHHAVIFTRKKHAASPAFLLLENRMEEALKDYCATLENNAVLVQLMDKRLDEHYLDFLIETNDVATAHLLDLVLNERTKTKNASIAPIPLELEMLEETYFGCLKGQVERAIEEFRATIASNQTKGASQPFHSGMQQL